MVRQAAEAGISFSETHAHFGAADASLTPETPHELFPSQPPSPEVDPSKQKSKKKKSHNGKGEGPVIHIAHWPERFDDPKKRVSLAAEKLAELGADRELLTSLFDRNGKLRLIDSSGIEVYRLDPAHAFEHMRAVLEPVYRANDVFLDEANNGERPYNAHGEQHHRDTYEITMNLLRGSGHIGKPDRFRRRDFKYPSDIGPMNIAREASIAVALHDGGYFYDPENHPEKSIELAEQVFPQLLNQPEAWKRISRAIKLHEGDELREELASRGVRTHAEVIEFLEQEYPYVPALILADKADQNRKRVRSEILGQKAAFVDPRDYLRDPHIEINLLTQIDKENVGWVRDSHDNRSGMPVIAFRTRIDFDQSVEPEEEEQMEYFLKERSSPKEGKRSNEEDEKIYKIDVSPETREAYLTNGKYYLDSLIERNLEEGASRLLRMAICSFALHPAQERADLVFYDVQTGREVRHTFYRETIDEDIECLWNAYVPDQKRSKRAPGELKI